MTALSGHLLSFQGHRVAVQGTQARPWAARNRSNRILPILGQTPIQGLSSGCPIGRSAASAGEKEALFQEVLPRALELMTDVFGNYVMQKLFEHGRQDHCEALLRLMEGHAVNLAMNM